MARDVRRETLLEILRGATYPVPGPLVNFRPLKLHRAVEDVNRKHGDVAAVRPRNFDPRATWDEMSTELRSTRSLRGLSPRAQRQAPWVLFYPLPKLPILGQDPELVRALLNLFESRQRPSQVIALLHCFLRDYPVEWGTFESLRTGIKKLLKARPDRRAKTRERADRYFLLEPKGPGRLA